MAAETETRPPSWDRPDLPSATLGAWGRSRRPWQRGLLLVVALAWALLAGVVGWRMALPERPAVPSLHPDLVVMQPEAAAVLDDDVHSADTHHGSGYGYLRVDAGGDPGQLLAEVSYTDQLLPAEVPPRPRPELTVEQRRERDRAFLEGEDAYEQWHRDMELDQQREPQPRGPVHDDREIDCVRVVVSTNNLADPDPDALDAIVAALEEYITDWLAHPATGQPCVGPWRSADG